MGTEMKDNTQTRTDSVQATDLSCGEESSTKWIMKDNPATNPSKQYSADSRQVNGDGGSCHSEHETELMMLRTAGLGEDLVGAPSSHLRKRNTTMSTQQSGDIKFDQDYCANQDNKCSSTHTQHAYKINGQSDHHGMEEDQVNHQDGKEPSSSYSDSSNYAYQLYRNGIDYGQSGDDCEDRSEHSPSPPRIHVADSQADGDNNLYNQHDEQYNGGLHTQHERSDSFTPGEALKCSV